ncbi:hypothetical protein RB601_001785 [Gaeumannomyces tritici]
MAIILPDMQAQQEDLATLFDRNMVLDQSVQQPPQQAQAQAPQITYSITQHYNHSSHVARQQQQQAQQQTEQRRFSEPSRSEYPTAEQILASHGINPSSLSPAQVNLFKDADDDQKRRLVELWGIFPPANPGFNSNSNFRNYNNYKAANDSAMAWSATSLENEEALGRLRYERLQQLRQYECEGAIAAAAARERSVMMSLDGTAVAAVPSQGRDGRWNVADESADYMMEPYMSSGYEVSSSAAAVPREYRPALDPAYRSAHSPVDWATRQRAMENQYGAFSQCRREA